MFLKKELVSGTVGFFEKSHLQLWQILGLTYLWYRIAGKSRGMSVADAQHGLQIGSELSIVDWNQYCRDIAVSHFLNNPIQIGGPGHILLGSCKTRHSKNILTFIFGLKLPRESLSLVSEKAMF